MKANKRVVLLLAIMSGLSLLAGCGKYIGSAKAKEIALADAGVTRADVRDLDCELDREVIGKTVYEVDFEIGLDEYEYKIDAVTGEILKSKVD